MSFYEGKRVLVTGASGLIGSHAIEALASRGARAVGIVHTTPPVVVDPRIEYRTADLTQREGCEAAVAGCELVVHAAASTSGAMVMRDNPIAHVTPNLLINAQLLEACARAGVKRFLFVSTTTVYPDVDHPLREDEGFVGEPHPTYFGVGWMKRYTEKLTEFYAQRFGLEFAILRPTNVYGPRDKFDFTTSHVLPALIRRAVDGADPFEVWGDGSAVRDFLYVSDMTDALLAALEHAADGAPLNVGSGAPGTIREAVELILRLAGREGARVVYDPSKPTSIPKRTVDLTQVRTRLGYEAKVSLEEGLTKTIAWYRTTKEAPAR